MHKRLETLILPVALAAGAMGFATSVLAQEFTGKWYGLIEGFSPGDPRRILVVSDVGGKPTCTFGGVDLPDGGEAKCAVTGSKLELVTFTNNTVHLAPVGDTLDGTFTRTATGSSFHIKMSRTPPFPLADTPNPNVPAWAIGKWSGTLRGPLVQYYSREGQDRQLIIGASGACTFSPPKKSWRMACTFSANSVTGTDAGGSHLYLQYKPGQLDGYYDGREGGRVFLTMSKQ